MQTTLAQFNETQSQEAFALQNSKLLKVRLGASGEIQAKAGSMVAYQGEVTFEHAGSGGIGRMMKKAMTGEGTTLMKMSGSGEVFLADQAQEVHLIYLENDFITVNGPNLLAFDADIDWDIKRVSGGASAAMAGGLFNLELRGTGWVAILSDGPPVLLNVASAPTFADAQAAITWSSGVTTSIKTDFKMKNLIGKGSGETIQMAFSGQGWVLVQPSEGQVVGPASQRRRWAREHSGELARSSQTWMTSPSSATSSTIASQFGHHQRASSAVPQAVWRSGSPAPLRAPQSASRRSAPASSRPLSVSS